ncbi:MAG: F0F1 ATP synthase subunit A [Anaerolineales bacterium]|nr:F0F1 ATP synthase subunit A [Anaerolineales bacterium]
MTTFFIAELKPIMPHIQLAPEAVFPHVGEAPLFNLLGQGFYITNTMIATWIAIAIILMIAWNLRKQLKAGSMVPTGISGAIAALLEGFYGMTESIAGKWTKKIFPWFATIFLLVLFVNLMELVPFVDSIGYFHESDHGYAVEKVWGVNTIVQTESAMHEGEEAHQGGYSLVPFVRVASTDLNFTLSLALIAVAMTQYMGFKALGPAYLKKFFDFQGLFAAFKEPRFNPIDVILGGARSLAGILEITAEIAKIVSFTFRLFGVIFAGSVLLFFVGSQVSGLGQSAVLLLELLFGPLQALVFGLLTMIFMSMATISHDYDHGHEEGHH